MAASSVVVSIGRLCLADTMADAIFRDNLSPPYLKIVGKVFPVDAHANALPYR